MGKASKPRQLADNEAKAVGRMIRTSPQKLNLVAQLIRGKKAEKAVADLTFSRRRVSDEVKNLVMKRFRPRAKGRAARIIKPFSQLTIVVREMEETQAGGEA